jgi:hypothetical protein
MRQFTVQRLRQLCKDRGLRGYSKKRKSELLMMLETVVQSPISPQKIICDVHDVLFPDFKPFRTMETRFMSKLRKNIEHTFEQYRFVADHVSTHDPMDFVLADGKTLSVRGNMRSIKICPREIGDLSVGAFIRRFKLSSPEKDVDEKYVKRWITENIHILLAQYVQHTFGDYLLWIDERTATCTLYARPKDIWFRDIRFTRTATQWINNNTVKSGKTVLGEFTFRNDFFCFQFNMPSLLKWFDV